MIDWLQNFYDDPALRDTLMRSFLPVFDSYVTEATGGPVSPEFVQSLADSYVERHLGSSRAQLQEVVKDSENPLAALQERFDEWEAKRPGKVAKNELVRSANAATVEKLQSTGVTKKIWRTSGGCPFCRSLDGVVISVDGAFLKEGDELNPEGATAPIHFESDLGHPPIHQGCVCSVESAYNEENIAKWMGQTEAGLEAGLNDPRLRGSDITPAFARLKDEFEEALRRKRFVPPRWLGAPIELSATGGATPRATVDWAKSVWGTKTSPFYKSLTPAQLDAATRYSGKDYSTFNSYLRRVAKGQTPRLPKTVAGRLTALQEAIDKTALPQAVRVQRGTTLSAFKRYHPREFIGKEIREPGYLSTSTKSLDGFGGYDHAVKMNITAPAGTRALYMEPVTQVKTEQEILFGRGTVMRVDAVREHKIRGRYGSPDRTEYEVDVTIVGAEPAPVTP